MPAKRTQGRAQRGAVLFMAEGFRARRPQLVECPVGAGSGDRNRPAAGRLIAVGRIDPADAPRRPRLDETELDFSNLDRKSVV
jgi:hypothetical protein